MSASFDDETILPLERIAEALLGASVLASPCDLTKVPLLTAAVENEKTARIIGSKVTFDDPG